MRGRARTWRWWRSTMSGSICPRSGSAAVDRDSPACEPVEGCHAVGYPLFAERPSPLAVRETVDAWGHVPVLSKLAAGLLSVQVSSSPRPLPPGRTALGESQWSGMSGCAGGRRRLPARGGERARAAGGPVGDHGGAADCSGG